MYFHWHKSILVCSNHIPSPEKEKTQELKMNHKIPKSVVIVVAHPDDETLWTGGTIFSHPLWNVYIVCICRGDDTERAPKFFNAIKALKSEGIMGSLDDGPDQNVHEGLVVKHKPYYAFWSYKIHSNERFDLLGNNSGEYHNGGIWPFICGFYVAALVATKRYALAREKLFALTCLIKIPNTRSVDFGFNEWVKAQNGKVMGQDWQTWSAALYLYAVKCVEEKNTPFFDALRM